MELTVNEGGYPCIDVSRHSNAQGALDGPVVINISTEDWTAQVKLTSTDAAALANALRGILPEYFHDQLNIESARRA